MSSRWSPTERVGLGLIVAGVCWYGVCAYWASTRVLTPLRMPISLAQGQVHTPEFTIDVAGGYLFEVEFQPDFRDRTQAGASHCPSPLPAVAWSLAQRGRTVRSGTRTGESYWPLSGDFPADAGAYTLHLDVKDDGTCLNAASPHLVVTADRSTRDSIVEGRERALLWSLFLTAVGVIVLLRGYNTLDPHRLTAQGPLPPEPGGPARNAAVDTVRLARARISSGRFRPKPEQIRVWAFQKASWFGVICFTILTWPWMVFCLARLHQVPQRGLTVHLERQEHTGRKQPGVDALLVCVGLEGRTLVRHLYIGSRRVPADDFEKTLRKELALRPPTWPVYVEGNPDLEWGAVAKAIDELRGLQAEVVLLARPPRVRQGESSAPRR